MGTALDCLTVALAITIVGERITAIAGIAGIGDLERLLRPDLAVLDAA